MRGGMARATGRRSSSSTWRRPATPSTDVSARRCIMPPDLGFVGGTLDRQANRRSDPEWLAARRAERGAKLIRLNGDKVVLNGGSIATEAIADLEASVFLGLDGQGCPVFAAETTESLA